MSADRFVAITGASSGIGRATALRLAEAGCRLLLGARRERELEATAEGARSLGAQVWFRWLDVSDPGACEAFAAEFQRRSEGSLPVLIQAAGVARFGSSARWDEDAARETVESNLLGAMRLASLAATWMRGGGGRIIHVLSIAAVRPLPGSSVYSASKAGLLAFDRVMREELRRSGVLVTSILPGAVDTPIWQPGSGPNRSDMLPAQAVAEAIAEIALAPQDRAYDELVLMPPKGIL
ncbi:MAG: SDR family oxidoreductase [Fimbriimonadales bacterium]|nr:SDR family oxidoreductase [Fimbriimonadales bacterium]